MTPARSYLVPCRHGKGKIIADEQTVNDINTVSDFLTSPNYALDYTSSNADTVYVLAGNAILPLAETLFDHLATYSSTEPAVLVISGGIGHSTSYLYEAVKRHPKYRSLYPKIDGKSEAETLHIILLEYWPRISSSIDAGELTLLIDQQSTNCGANAVESKKLLDRSGIWPRSLYIVQDPTMHRRTAASFEKIYAEDERSQTHGMPILLPSSFTPHLSLSLSDDRGICWSLDRESCNGRQIGEGELWDVERFVSLVMGEIPRLRDDKTGYGPKGAGFISHVNIPAEVEGAWARLSDTFAVRKA
ncbi:hypothetical protein I317_00864 [Kwoniella heveanensis CBS 569]|nr:hypothetical protein I317_00864 [Kwoniella heveanensis CBS 569]